MRHQVIRLLKEEGPALRRPHAAGYQIVEGLSLEGAAAALLATCMDKRIDMYGRRGKDNEEYEDTRDAFLVNGQVSGSERAGVIEGEVSTTVHNRSLVLTYERVIHQECYGMYQVAMVGHSLGEAAGTLATFLLEDGITSIRCITYG